MDEKLFKNLPIKEVYKDLLQPGMRKIGSSLETVFELSNSILLPIKLLNERSRMIFDRNMKRYAEKLDNIPDDKLSQVPPYVGLPILDKLTYLSDETLAEIFINLLSKASTNETLNLVHPSYISTLNDLSKDEATILFEFNNQEDIPFIDIYLNKTVHSKKKPPNFDKKGPKSRDELKESIDYTFQDKQIVDIRAAWNLTGIEHFINLDFPENIDIYINNLDRQNIIEFERSNYNLNQITIYEALEGEHYKKIIDGYREDAISLESENDDGFTAFKLNVKRGRIQFTDYGRGFMNACLKEIKNNA
ncbi:DUF4393 domain-containing protein [Ekhidna sp.]|uniref:DUF4393 domain-containing protein n=1 Tax=Ekhidna sp. TaxID=2608089 RepID=UPI0032997C8B